MRNLPEQRRRQKRERGFTLTELMVVIVIIGLLVTVVGPNVIGYLTQGKWTKVKADIRALDSAITTYTMRNNGRYPESIEELVLEDEYGNTYLNRETLPKDPWGNEYLYDPPGGGEKYRVYTYGADGAPGGEGDEQDYSNVDLRNE